MAKGGMRLLKRSQKGIIRAVFSRIGLMTVMLLLHFGIFFSAFFWLGEQYLPHFYGLEVLISVGSILYLINCSAIDPSAKITWLVVLMLMPVFGGLLLLYSRSDLGHRALKKRIQTLVDETEFKIPQNEEALELLRKENPGSAALAHYLRAKGGFPVYSGCDVTYFPSGEAKFEALMCELERAREFIFLEYFIVDEGEMWGRILEILTRKASEGVDVRLIYDGTCEFTTLSHDYPKRLSKLGIQCRVFSPVTPFMSTHYNYRDHRKILVIDGKTAFTGGVNLADEYINAVEKHGHWKDTAVMIRGAAVKSFTLLFLQMWCIQDKNPDFSAYLAAESESYGSAGYVIPYADCPLDEDKVGERVYMDLLNRAEKFVHVMTPYLILDGELETALKFAAERGVEVALILPGIPDKKTPYALAKTHYPSLLASGVKIYEYTPGFVHAKVFSCDGREAVVGTINLDYRSLYHHFECAAYLCGTGCIGDIEADFADTLAKCREVTAGSLKKGSFGTWLRGVFMKAAAPLL